MAKNNVSNDRQSMEKPNTGKAAYYPHGLARNTQTAEFSTNKAQVLIQPKQYKDDNNDEELPF